MKETGNMSRILGYGCTSSAGAGVDSFWKILSTNVDLSPCQWPKSEKNRSTRELLVSQLLLAWKEARPEHNPSQRLGVIYASTKGCIEDFVWDSNSKDMARDPYAPVLEDFLRVAELKTENTLCVSNACASTLAAVFLADQWIRQERAEQVLVLAADRAGPFVLQGFHCLRALSPTQVRPFSKNRDGVRPGEAAVAILIGASGTGPGFELNGVGLDTEGHAVTRPAESGESLIRACQRIPCLSSLTPDVIIAHGTGTQTNDEAEDRVFAKLFNTREKRPRVTATKGSIGHTLGASGGMDLIAACEILKRQQVFSITNTSETDPSFQYRGEYLTIPSFESQVESTGVIPLDDVLITSLGFGGTHAAAWVSRSRRNNP